MQINSIGQQPNFNANTVWAKKAMAIDPKTKQAVAMYTNYTENLNKFKGMTKLLPSYAGEQGENQLFLLPKDFGDIICIKCKDGQASREQLVKYFNGGNKSGFAKVVIEQ